MGDWLFFFCLFFGCFVVAVWLLVGLPPCLFCLSASLRSVAYVLCSCFACFARFFLRCLGGGHFLAFLARGSFFWWSVYCSVWGFLVRLLFDLVVVHWNVWVPKIFRCSSTSKFFGTWRFFVDFVWSLGAVGGGFPVECFCLPVPGGNRLFPQKQLISSGDK